MSHGRFLFDVPRSAKAKRSFEPFQLPHTPAAQNPKDQGRDRFRSQSYQLATALIAMTDPCSAAIPLKQS
jgi:hypothetical protein